MLRLKQESLVNSVDHHVAEADEVILPTGVHEVQLIQARKSKIASERIHGFLSDVAPCFRIHKSCGEAKIYQVEGAVLEYRFERVFLEGFVVRWDLLAVPNEDVVQLQVVEDVPGIVDLFQ